MESAIMNTTTSHESPYLTVAQVAKRPGISPDTVWRWAGAGDFPKPLKMGPNTTRWKLSDIHSYEAKLTICYVEEAFDLSSFVSRVAA
jgi:prophage regulatory protein